MSDSKMIESLIRALQYEYKTYLNILKIAEKKTDCLISNDAAAISSITEEENKEAERTVQLNQVREQLLEKLCEDMGLDFKTFTLTKLIQKTTGPEKARLEELRSKLGDVIAKLSARNGINQKLIENAIKYIDFSMQIISTPVPGVQTYGRGGQEVANAPKKSVLDVKF